MKFHVLRTHHPDIGLTELADLILIGANTTKERMIR